MIEIDAKDLKKYTECLKSISDKAYPKAVRATLDRLAFLTKKAYDKQVRKYLTIRGDKKANIVTASIGYEKCSDSLDINKMHSMTGQRAVQYGKPTDQLKKQELGETIVSKTKHLVKPTKFARGGSFKHLVNRKNYLAGMDLKRIDDLTPNPAKAPQNQFKQAVAIAHRTLPEGEFIHFLPESEIDGKKFGVFKLINNGSRKDKDGSLKANKSSVKFMYSFSDRTQAISPKPMLKTATEIVAKTKAKIYLHEAERRIAKETQKLKS